MRLFNHYLLHTFVVLLITVLITNTVYAAATMASVSFNGLSASAQSQADDNAGMQHCHDHAHSDKRYDSVDSSLYDQSQDTSQSYSACSDCTHCMACCSMIPQQHSEMGSVSGSIVLTVVPKPLYLSPASPQPNKPPIA